MKGTRIRRAVRVDRRAVSPVIASILLVAITVILAAVLFDRLKQRGLGRRIGFFKPVPLEQKETASQ